MSDFLDLLERDLVDAAQRRRDARRAALALRLRGRFGPGRAVALVAALVLAGSATAAATYAVLRGSVLPGPDARAVPPDQLPEPGTSRLGELRAADPQPGVPPWTLRVARSTTGLVCTTVGQLVGDRIGLVGLDGRFRAFDDNTVNGCGEVGRTQPLIGARVFAADRPADVRTVVNGVAGDQLREVVVATAPAGPRTIPVGEGGTFVAALRGYPEDIALEVELSYADGRVRAFPLGRAEGIVLDPEGGPAWKASLGGSSGDARSCVTFGPARAFALGVSPPACGLMDARRPRGAFFAVRRLEPGPRPRPPFRIFDPRGYWGDRPARTAVWGAAGADVERIEIAGAPGGTTRLTVGATRTFLAVYPATVDPADLSVRVVYGDGRVERHRGDANLVERKVPRG